ncbi:MAG: transglycosylase SLT domain-containing protein [Myxococcales bacterium]|nr:transglycosylase SLT domain-containing protein [Myxococcales bacterium]MDD9969525.1 transglycosylase SLT domain-containing protein [Myxococcales bacterium]
MFWTRRFESGSGLWVARAGVRRTALLVICGLLFGCAVASSGLPARSPVSGARTGIGRDLTALRQGRTAGRDQSGPDVVERRPDIDDPLPPLRRFTKREWRRIRAVQRIVHRYADRYEMAPALVNGVIWVESKFRRRARRGRRGARGLMQLMPRTGRLLARELKRRYMPYSADFNIHAGTHYLADMISQFDDATLGLAAYQRGPARLRVWMQTGQPHLLATVWYVRRIRQAASAFCQRLPDVARTSGSGFDCHSQAAAEQQVEEPGVVIREERQPLSKLFGWFHPRLTAVLFDQSSTRESAE